MIKDQTHLGVYKDIDVRSTEKSFVVHDEVPYFFRALYIGLSLPTLDL